MRNIIQELEKGEREQGGGENWLGENGEKARLAESCVCVGRVSERCSSGRME